MMRQDKDQTQVLLWTATGIAFLFLLFKVKVFENIEYSPYIPWIAVGLLLIQLINHEQASISLRRKSPNFTNNFYAQNGRMVFVNALASAIVLELNMFNYENSHLNFTLDLIGIPFLLIVIFFVENSQGGFMSLKRIYFPKKWDQVFKAYGADIISLGLMIAMWIPVIFRIPMSAFLWIFMSTLLLRASIIYTNKYNHVGWCFLLEGVLVLQLLSLGFQGRQVIFLGLGAIAGLLFLGIYAHRMACEKGWIVVAMVLFMISLAISYYFWSGQASIMFYLQWELVLLVGVLVLAKIFSLAYQKYKHKGKSKEYSLDGMPVFRKAIQAKEGHYKKPGHKKTILLKKAEGSSKKAKVKLKPRQEEKKPVKNTEYKPRESKRQEVEKEQIPSRQEGQRQARKPIPVKAGSEKEARKPTPVKAGSEKEARKPIPVKAGSEKEAREPIPVKAGSEKEAREPIPVKAGSEKEARKPIPVKAGSEKEARKPIPVKAGSEKEAREPIPTKDGREGDRNFKLGEGASNKLEEKGQAKKADIKNLVKGQESSKSSKNSSRKRAKPRKKVTKAVLDKKGKLPVFDHKPDQVKGPFKPRKHQQKLDTKGPVEGLKPANRGLVKPKKKKGQGQVENTQIRTEKNPQASKQPLGQAKSQKLPVPKPKTGKKQFPKVQPKQNSGKKSNNFPELKFSKPIPEKLDRKKNIGKKAKSKNSTKPRPKTKVRKKYYKKNKGK